MRMPVGTWSAGLAVAVGLVLPGRGLAGEEPQPVPYPPTAVHVKHFDTDKVLYDEGEPVVFRALLELSNAGPSLVPSPNPVVTPPLVVQVWDEHDLEPPALIAETKLDPKDPSSPVSVELTWKSAGGLYGHQAHLRVLDSAGRLLAQASTIYEICTQWQYVIRLATTEAAKLIPEGATEADLQRVVRYLREGGANTVELYSTTPDYYVAAPDQPTWRPVHRPGPKDPRLSAANIQRFRQLLRDNGLRLVMYNETSAINPQVLGAGEDAEALRVYRRQDDGKLELCAPYYQDKGWFLPNSLKVAERFERMLTQEVSRFGWDGLLADSATGAFQTTAQGYDAQGRRLTELTPGEIGRRYFAGARRAARALNPRFRVICQNIAASMLLAHYHWRQPDDRIETVIGQYMREMYGALFEEIDAWSAEIDPHYENQTAYPQTYDKYALILNIGREVSGRPILVWMHISNPHIGHEYAPEYARPLVSVLGASRVTWHDHFSNYGGWWGPWRPAPVNQVQVQAHRFVARFGKYLRAPELRWVSRPETVLAVESPRELFWRRTVYQRDYADGSREVTVNLINLDSPLVRPSNEGQPPHRVPPAAFPVTVRYLWPPGADPGSVRVTALDAEDGALRPLALAATVADGRLTVSAPPVRSWVVLVIRHGPGARP